jgi:photosystem II stability/assembly factor-like uncharacterized protein
MEPFPSRRTLRAATLIGVAIATVLAAGVVVHLRPSFRTPARARTPPPPRPAVGSVFFADADHGVVAVIPAGGGSSPLATVFLTSDGGRTWSRELGGPASVILSSPLSGSRLLVVASIEAGAGIRVSDNGGRTWRRLPAPPGVLQPYIVYSASGTPLMLTPTDGWWMTRPAPGDPYTVELWRTHDGPTWARLLTAGIPGDGIKEQLWFADDRHGLLLLTYGNTEVSVLATDDGGANWQERARFGPPFPGAWTLGAVLVSRGGRQLLSLETLPKAPDGSALAGPFTQSVGVFTATSTDGGMTWGPLVPGPRLASPSVPLFDDKGRMLLLSDRQFWVSATYGAGWQSQPVALPAGVRVLGLEAAVSGTLFAIGVTSAPVRGAPANAFPPRILLRSRDGGGHWEQLALPTLAG